MANHYISQTTIFWRGCDNDWFRCINECLDSTMRIGYKYQIVCWFKHYNVCPDYEHGNIYFFSQSVVTEYHLPHYVVIWKDDHSLMLCLHYLSPLCIHRILKVKYSLKLKDSKKNSVIFIFGKLFYWEINCIYTVKAPQKLLNCHRT